MINLSDMIWWQQALVIYSVALYFFGVALTVASVATKSMKVWEALCMLIISPLVPVIALVVVVIDKVRAKRLQRAKRALNKRSEKEKRLLKQKLI